jgi:hypothetical protein
MLVAGGCAGDAEIPPPRPTAQQQDRIGEAQQTLVRLRQALDRGDVQAARQLASPGAEDLLAGVTRNAEDLGLTGVSLRFVDDDAELDEGQADDLPDGAWVATVQLGYRIPRWDPGPTQLETTVVFAPEAGRQRIAGFGTGGSRTPVWLTGRLTIDRSGRVLVMAADASHARSLLAQGTRAVRDVDAVLPSWEGRLVLLEPDSEAVLEGALDAEAGQYDAIAAVTSSVDGSLVEGAPVHVWFNPDVFDRLGPKGAQVVVSHEATHVATGATFSAMPKWLSEGFADYVALLHADVPVGEAAGQVLARVRRSGPPERLPGSADLDPTASGLGATYEEAWLACRFMAERFGQQRLVAFYRAVEGGSSVERAFREVLGTTQTLFESAWSRNVARLAAVHG